MTTARSSAAAFTALLRNLGDTPRWFAGVVDLETAGGLAYANWRQGWTVIPGGQCLEEKWCFDIPCLSTLQGMNRFHLSVLDVTPAPFNQPPFPASGHADDAVCTVYGR